MIRSVVAVALFSLVVVLASCGEEEEARVEREPRLAVTGTRTTGVASRPMTPEEVKFAADFAGAIADDVLEHGPEEPLVRAVVRWFEATDPLYFTVHVLPASARDDVPPEDAWYPLEWPNVDEEMERTDRLTSHAALQRAGAPLADRYENDPAMQEDVEEWGDQLLPSPAVIETVRRLPDALRAAGVRLDDEFVASAAHFEGYGTLAVLKATALPATIAALDARGELPEE